MHPLTLPSSNYKKKSNEVEIKTGPEMVPIPVKENCTNHIQDEQHESMYI